MHYQTCVRPRYGFEDVQKQANACLRIETTRIAIPINVIAFNIVENEIRLSGLRYARVEQFCNVRMDKTAENCPLAL